MSSSASELVRIKTGMQPSSGSFLISASTSRPPFLGMFRSSRISSGRGTPACFPCRRRNASVSSPSTATLKLSRSRPSRKASRISHTSPGLSSPRSTSIGRRLSGLLMVSFLSRLRRSRGKGEEECRATSKLRLHPDATAVPFDDLLADCEPDAGARVLRPCMEPLEELEDPLAVLGIDTDPVVADREDPLRLRAPRRDVHPGGGGAAELDRVRDQVLEELDHLQALGRDPGQGVVGHHGLALLYRQLQVQ